MFARRFRAATTAAALGICGLLGAPGAADAGEPALTRARVAELVLAAPASRVAAADVDVAHAGVEGAGTLALDNPVLSGMLGARWNPDGTRPVAGVATLSIPVELGGQRGARVLAAQAGEGAAQAFAADTRRRLLLGALLQHAGVLLDERRLVLAGDRRLVAAKVLASAQRQREAGSVPELDVVLAGLQAAREAAAEQAARGARDADRAALLAMLGVEGAGAEARGSLIPPDDVPDLAAMERDLEKGTEVAAARAALRAAQGRSAREEAAAWPSLSVLAQFERDDGASTGMLGLAVPIPLLNANRAGVSTSRAEEGAAKARLDAARAAAAGALRQAHARYRASKDALETLAPTAALLGQALSLATRSYELGEGDLASMLLVRRETGDAQTALLEAEHAHAAAKLELLIAAGRVPR